MTEGAVSTDWHHLPCVTHIATLRAGLVTDVISRLRREYLILTDTIVVLD